MITYRIARRPYAGLTGEGARLYGGRFNPPGIPAVYTSQSIALAVLEILVHIEKSEVPADYVVMAIQFPGGRVSRQRGENLIGVNRLPIDRFKAAFCRLAGSSRAFCDCAARVQFFVLLPQAVGFAATIEWVEPLSFDRRLFSLRE